MFGLAAVVLCPTRELALQIFEVLRKIGHHHSFSAGLVIGGKDKDEEALRINQMNILIATPGRLRQHMNETPNFECSNLLMVVLDEADRILDTGFRNDIDAIFSEFPTVWFRTFPFSSLVFPFSIGTPDTPLLSHADTVCSYTLTCSYDCLLYSHFSLIIIIIIYFFTTYISSQNPVYIWANELKESATPAKLVQKYVMVELSRKIDVIWSFITTHKRSKTIIFFSSCKEVAFLGEAFAHLRPGVSLLFLHGKMKQMKRFQIFARFSESKHGLITSYRI